MVLVTGDKVIILKALVPAFRSSWSHEDCSAVVLGFLKWVGGKLQEALELNPISSQRHRISE